MIDLGRETDGYNKICLGVRFALCIIKALRLARIEHCSGTVVTRFLPSGENYIPKQKNHFLSDPQAIDGFLLPPIL